jgi:hypothetical protein
MSSVTSDSSSASACEALPAIAYFDDTERVATGKPRSVNQFFSKYPAVLANLQTYTGSVFTPDRQVADGQTPDGNFVWKNLYDRKCSNNRSLNFELLKVIVLLMYPVDTTTPEDQAKILKMCNFLIERQYKYDFLIITELGFKANIYPINRLYNYVIKGGKCARPFDFDTWSVQNRTASRVENADCLMCCGEFNTWTFRAGCDNDCSDCREICKSCFKSITPKRCPYCRCPHFRMVINTDTSDNERMIKFNYNNTTYEKMIFSDFDDESLKLVRFTRYLKRKVGGEVAYANEIKVENFNIQDVAQLTHEQHRDALQSGLFATERNEDMFEYYETLYNESGVSERLFTRLAENLQYGDDVTDDDVNDFNLMMRIDGWDGYIDYLEYHRKFDWSDGVVQMYDYQTLMFIFQVDNVDRDFYKNVKSHQLITSKHTKMFNDFPTGHLNPNYFQDNLTATFAKKEYITDTKSRVGLFNPILDCEVVSNRWDVMFDRYYCY